MRFFALFLALLAALFAAELTPGAQALVVIPWTEALVRISVALITLFDAQAVAIGRVLLSSRNGFSVSIEAGCNGIEAAIVLIAAMLAFPAPWRYRVIGIVVGLVAVQALNIVRVVTLFYLGQWSFQAYEWAHLYVWQALIMLDVLLVWMVWIRRLPRAADRTAGAPPEARVAAA